MSVVRMQQETSVSCTHWLKNVVLNVVVYYLVAVSCKMDKIKELESRMDKYLELESRKQCLLELPSKGENALKDTIDFYIEQQYYCYCQYLRECLDYVDNEWVEIGIKKGCFGSNKDKKPWFRASKC